MADAKHARRLVRARIGQSTGEPKVCFSHEEAGLIEAALPTHQAAAEPEPTIVRGVPLTSPRYAGSGAAFTPRTTFTADEEG